MALLSAPIASTPILAAFPGPAQVSQANLSALIIGEPNAAVPQANLSALIVGNPNALVSQASAQVLYYVPWRNGTVIVIT
jgi:hypothetical protein